MQTKVYIDGARTRAQMAEQREVQPLPALDQIATITPPSNITSPHLPSPNSIVVDGGPLVLEFPLLFLREKGEREHDVNITAEDL